MLINRPGREWYLTRQENYMYWELTTADGDENVRSLRAFSRRPVQRTLKDAQWTHQN